MLQDDEATGQRGHLEHTFWILLELREIEVVVTTGLELLDVQSSSQNVSTNKPTPKLENRGGQPRFMWLNGHLISGVCERVHACNQ